MEKEQFEMDLPKKLLRVEELTFQLPDDFEGDIKSALRLLLDYLQSIFGDSNITPQRMREIALLMENEGARRIEMNFGIFERADDGKYYLK